jgi:hypothetical protein
MYDKLKVRYVPAWLTAVADYYKTDIDKLECIVSKHDLVLYGLANTMLRTKLQQLGIHKDFVFPDVMEGEVYSQDDALFALYGQNHAGKTIPDFNLSRFAIRAGKAEGEIYLVELADGDECNLVKELLCAVSQYCGRKVAHGSDSFRRYLSAVKI